MLGIDWELLREQKEWLTNQNSTHADGLLCLLDAIMDDAVDSGEFTEIEVFGALDSKE